MANFRQIHVSIWKDPWFLDLDPDQKLLFIYLFSNESTSLSGLYEISLRVICFETNLSSDFVKDNLNFFQEKEKIRYDAGVIWVKNLRKYNASSSETVQIRIRKDLATVPDCPIKKEYITYYGENIPYRYDTDTLYYEEKKNEEKRNESEEKNPVVIISCLYEQEIGPLTPMIGEQIKDWSESYPLVWLERAIEIATTQQKRNVGYINGILNNFQKEGFDHHKGIEKSQVVDMEEQREEDAKKARERLEKGRKAKEGE